MSIVYTNDNCIGCNKCIKVCSAIGACVSKEENGKARIEVDGSKCVACGSCIDVCVHGAREFEDDTERFFEDLKNGEKISLLLAPAFKANYPEEYESVLGGLKNLGINRIISVSFGADITTWGYLNYIERYDFLGGISQPCPAAVSYIERYLPELLPKLFPVQSPLMCAAIYARKEMGITDRFAFISPCIAKKLEIEDPHNEGLVQYNVTFEHLMRYVKEHDIQGPETHSEVEYGLGSFYPTPGGLAENVKWFLGDDVFIRQIEGERHLYEWMHQNADRIRNDETPFLFIDALNCEKGCICGTAVNSDKSRTDDALYELLRIREESKKKESGDAWSRPDTPAERLANYNRQFADLDLNDYIRGYTDRSAECKYEIPNAKELDDIFVSMNKLTEESRCIDCTCCGYESCTQMATAIFNGFNHKENCIYYEKTMVRELEAEKLIAEQTAQAKNAFLANMSHEIRTPINAVLGMNEMILRESDDPGIINYSNNIKSAAGALLGLVNNILDFSKIESGSMDINPVDYDLLPVIDDLVNMVITRAEEKGLMVNVFVNKDIPRHLHGDELRIKQIISNIFMNAVKYTEKGGVTLGIEYEPVEGDDSKILMNVSVKDTGIGIKPEDLDRLFVKFERIEEKRNRSIEGTGLGINVTASLLEMMGSSLKVKSEYGKGSNFYFSILQDVVDKEPLGEYESAYKRFITTYMHTKDELTAPDAHLLYVDDNGMNLMVFKQLLKRTGVQIDTVDNADEALALMRKNIYDLMFFDHMMPGKDGIETLHELKSEKDNPNYETPVVCLTANAISGAREYYLNEGFDDYLSKPVETSKLEEMLFKYLPKDKIIIIRSEDDGASKEEIPEELKVLEGNDRISIESGLANSGSIDAYIPLIKVFYDSVDDRTDEIELYYAQNDIKDYTIKVHALKSSARLIGAMQLGEDAQRLEDAGKAGDIDYIREHHREFIDECIEIKILLRPVYLAQNASDDDSDKPPADESMMKGFYDRIRQAAEDMDCTAIEEAFEELDGYAVPADEKEKYDSLKKMADSFDYDGIADMLK